MVGVIWDKALLIRLNMILAVCTKGWWFGFDSRWAKAQSAPRPRMREHPPASL